MSSIRKSPSSNPRHSMIPRKPRSKSRLRKFQSKELGEKNPSESCTGGGSELEREVPVLYVTSTLRHELEALDKKEEVAVTKTTPKKPSWAELYDKNNNLILNEVVTPTASAVSLSSLSSVSVSLDETSQPLSIRLATCPEYTVFNLGGTQEGNISDYQNTICTSQDFAAMTFPSPKSPHCLGGLTSKLLEWNIPGTEDQEIIISPEEQDEMLTDIDLIEAKVAVESISPSLPSGVILQETDMNQEEGLNTRSRLPSRIPSQPSYLGILSPMRLEADPSNPDFVTQFMRSIIPEHFDTDDFVSQAYSMGSKLINAGLQLATSFIGDESDLEPREDVIKYNGYTVRTSGRGVLLQGIYINCNLHQAHPDLERVHSERSSRLRIVVSLNHNLDNNNQLANSSSEHGYHSERDPRVIIEDGKWTFLYREPGIGNIDPRGHLQGSLVEIQVPTGVSPELIRYSGLGDGNLIIEAP